VQRDYGALITVHSDARVVERLLRVSQLVPQVGHAALEDAAEVARDQRATDAWKKKGDGENQSQDYSQYTLLYSLHLSGFDLGPPIAE
jgi:hypothetical protein